MKNRFLTRLSILVLLITIVIPLAVSAAGVDPNGTRPPQQVGRCTVHMHDLGDLLSNREEQELIDSVAPYCKKMSYNILFLTTNNAGGKSTMVYSDDYMDELFPDTDENIAFIIDMDNRQIYINTMGRAIRFLSDDKIEKGLDAGYPHIKNNEYYECLREMSSYALNKLKWAEMRDSNFLVFLATEMVRYILPSVIVTALVVLSLIHKHKRANLAHSPTAYVPKDLYEVIDKKENFIRSYDTVQRDYYKKSESSGGSSGSSGGGSSHTSSSGRSHGGGGRSF